MKTKKRNIYIIVVLSIVVYSVFKIRFGLNTDEIGTVGEGITLFKGTALINENWSYLQSSGLFTAPFAALYSWITGGLEGWLLFMRYIYLIIQLLISVAIYNSLKIEYPKSAPIVALMNYLYVFNWSSVQYKSLLIWGATLTFLCIYNWIRTNKKIYLVIGGLSLCVAVLGYPSSILLVVPAVVAIVIYSKEKKCVPTMIFIGTCLMVGLAIVLPIIARFGVGRVVVCAREILSNDLYKESTLSKAVRNILPIIAIGLVENTIGFLVEHIAKKKNREFKHRNLICMLVFMLILVVICAFRIESAGPSRIWYILLAVFLMFPTFLKWNKGVSDLGKKKLLLLSFIPCLFLLLSIFLASNQGIAIIAYGAILGLYGLTILFIETSQSKSFVYMFTGVLMLISMFFVADQVGGSNNMLWKKVRFENGIAKGLYSSEEVVSKYDSIYNTVKKTVRDGNKLLLVGADNMASGYFDTKSVHATPMSAFIVWDSTIYGKYYELNPDRYPEIIIIDTDYIANQSEFYETSTLGRFIKENYNIENCQEVEGYSVIK